MYIYIQTIPALFRKWYTSSVYKESYLSYNAPVTIQSRIYKLTYFVDALTSLLKAGSALASAAEKFIEWADEDKGSVLITVNNYCKDKNLVDISYHVVTGEINQVEFDVISGGKQGIAAGGEFLGQSEGLVGWSLPNTDMKAVIYWRVPREYYVISQKANKLGIGFVDGSGSSDWLKNLATSDEDLSIPSIGMHEFLKDGVTLQCCHDDICMQGIMTTNHHSNVTVRILPKNSSELFHTDDPAKDQNYLNEVLNLSNTCTSSSKAASGVTVSLFLVITSAFCSMLITG